MMCFKLVKDTNMKFLKIQAAPSVVLLATVGCWPGEPKHAATSAHVPAFDLVKTGPTDPGIKVGETAPKFSLNDQDGKKRSLDEFLRSGKVALVFVRSIGTSPHCRQHLIDLKDGRKRIEKAGAQIVGISADPVSALNVFAEAQKISFPLLSDEGGETAKAYGISDQKDDSVIQPGAFLVDSQGVIKAKNFSPLIQFRVTAGELADAAGKVE